MAFESHIPPVVGMQVVRAKPDAERGRFEERAKREHKDRRPRQGDDHPTHPVPNVEGQIIGKLVDTTA